MSKVEDFIRENTRNCSLRHCITPDQARKAVEIAREETIKEVCEWLDNHLIDYWSQSVTDGSGFIEDLKQAMKDE